MMKDTTVLLVSEYEYLIILETFYLPEVEDR